MAFVKLEVARGSGRPTADVRVMVSDVRSTRQVGIIMARGVMDSMGVDLGAELDLHVGQGEDAGWLRLETASGRNGRKLGKLPQTQSGLAKFPVVAPLDLPEARSTDVDEWRVEPGALTLRLPATLRGGMPDRPAAMHGKPAPMQDKAAPMQDKAPAAAPVARAAPPVEPPKPAPQPPQAPTAAAPKPPAPAVARPAPPPVLPRAETGSGSRSKHDAPLEVDAADPDARDRLEAMQELRKGKSVRDVARDFGFKIALVASWQEQVLAERAAKGRAA